MNSKMVYQNENISFFQLIVISVILQNFSLAVNAVVSPKLRLNDGTSIPYFGLGTYMANGDAVEQAVKDAIDAGYRYIDTAMRYFNEIEVGNAIRAKIDEGVITREDIYVTTKLWNTFHEPDVVAIAFNKSYVNLSIGYIDLYVMHAPQAYQRILKNQSDDEIEDTEFFPYDDNGQMKALNVDYMDTWRAMEKLLESGKVRSLGVSAFNHLQLERILNEGTIKPVVNQIETHPNLNENQMIKFATERNVKIVALCPLGRPNDSDAVNRKIAIFDKKVQEIANKYNKTTANIVLRYNFQRGIVVIPKSINITHIQRNIDIFNFELDESEMNYLSNFKPQQRIFTYYEDINNINYPYKTYYFN